MTRLREKYAQLCKETDILRKRAHMADQQLSGGSYEVLRHENERLKQLLQVNGINYDRILPVTNGLPTPTQSQDFAPGQASMIQPNISPPTRQYYGASQQPQGLIFDSTSFALPSSSADSSKTMTQTSDNMDITSPSIPQQNYNNVLSHSPSSVSSSQHSFSYHSHSSTNGSNYPPQAPTPVSTTNRSSPVYPMNHQMQQNNADTIDSVIANCNPSNFRPTVAQTSANGGSMPTLNDEPAIKNDMDDGQLAINFVLA